MYALSACPICKQTGLSAYISCKDYSVSQEVFNLEKCNACGFVMTNPRPDDKDLPKYYQSGNYISHTDKSTNLIDEVYKISRTFTLQWKLKLINKHSIQPPYNVLDYGCGTGAFLKVCKNHKLQIAGVEPSSIAREQAQRNAGMEIHPTIDHVNGFFDVITLWHVLEHVGDINATIDKLKTRLHKNGTMFIAVPNLQSNDALQYGVHWAAYDVPRHLWHFSQTAMNSLLTNHQLKIHRVIPMRLDAYYVSLLSEKYRMGKNGIQSMARALFKGLKSNLKAKKTKEYSSLIYLVRK